jgi:thiol-disulfide isomerase/thioredoxin
MPSIRRLALGLSSIALLSLSALANSALAGKNDDLYEGNNIFILYGGNGAIIQPRTTLEESKKRSRDAKQMSPVISQLQVNYEKQVNFIAINADAFVGLPEQKEARKYYQGKVPHTLIFDRTGKLTYSALGVRPAPEVTAALKAVIP